MAAINDCLYRNRNKTKYLAFFDIDDFFLVQNKGWITRGQTFLNDSQM